MGKHGNKHQVNLHSQKIAKISLKTCMLFREKKCTWGQISVDCVQRTVLSMPRRLQMVIDANGDTINNFIVFNFIVFEFFHFSNLFYTPLTFSWVTFYKLQF
jgi:hypothetical protein